MTDAARRDPFLIIANPAAGRGRGRRTAEAVADHLRQAGAGVSVRYTTSSGEAEDIARASASGTDRPACIVVCGGDGTVQEVANALAYARESLGESTPLMGLAPAGRCNDFARALGIAADPAASQPLRPRALSALAMHTLISNPAYEASAAIR